MWWFSPFTIAGNGLRKHTCVCVWRGRDVTAPLHIHTHNLAHSVDLLDAESPDQVWKVWEIQALWLAVHQLHPGISWIDFWHLANLPHVWMRERNFCAIVIHLPFLLKWLAMRYITQYAYINTHTDRQSEMTVILKRQTEMLSHLLCENRTIVC